MILFEIIMGIKLISLGSLGLFYLHSRITSFMVDMLSLYVAVVLAAGLVSTMFYSSFPTRDMGQVNQIDAKPNYLGKLELVAQASSRPDFVGQ